jgi:hypothetical protein
MNKSLWKYGWTQLAFIHLLEQFLNFNIVRKINGKLLTLLEIFLG